MKKPTIDEHRKDEHVALAEKFHADNRANDFDKIRFVHQSLPEIKLTEVDISVKLPDFFFNSPIYINGITGGSQRTMGINQQLAEVATQANIAMSSGSQSVAIKNPELMHTFSIIRETNPAGIVFANMGAGHGLSAAKEVVAMLNANGLEIHLNVPQEIVMPEGDQNFYWSANIQEVIAGLDVPVIVKEVGFGMSQETIAKLISLNVPYIDVSGTGGTNFIQIENARRPHNEMGYLDGWGQSTVESLLEAYPFRKYTTILASGGIRNALDIVKALRLGANAVGVSGTILHALLKTGPTETAALILSWQAEIKHILAMLGVHSIKELRSVPIIYDETLISYAKQRKLKLP